jgi:hypothetical protein
LIASVIRGAVTAAGCAHDMVCVDAGLRIEIKLSQLNVAIRGRGTQRWAWTKVFGESGNKKYDRLVLVGVADERFRTQYRDPRVPYVFFDIPFPRVGALCVPVQSGRYKAIFLTTNPASIRSFRSKTLFSDYQTTYSELVRYGLR